MTAPTEDVLRGTCRASTARGVDIVLAVTSPAGDVISEGSVVHVSLFVDGLVQRMDVEEPA